MNPEFQRNLWLEWTRPRLVSAFSALGALLAVAWLSNQQAFGSITANAALACIVMFTLAWGAHLCGQSLHEELRGRTWDQQRMSALSPWRMTWGKLAGAPAVAWACGGVAALVYLLSEPASDAWWMLLALAAAAIGTHASALIGELLLAQRGQQAGLPVALRFAAVLGLWAAGRWIVDDLDGGQRWFGHAYPALPFNACVIVALAAWMVFGCYRLMCDELKVRTRPWALGAFIAFIALLYSGFAYEPGLPLAGWFARFASLAFGGALLAAYVCALAFTADPMIPHRLRGYARRGEWRRVAEEAPLWTIACGYALPLALLTVLLGGTAGAAGPVRLDAASVPALLLYATRDLAVFFGIACRAPRRGVEASQLIYLALAYGLVPLIGRLGGGDIVAHLLLPDPAKPMSAAAVLAGHALVALWWTRTMWRQRMAEGARAPGSGTRAA